MTVFPFISQRIFTTLNMSLTLGKLGKNMVQITEEETASEMNLVEG